MTYPNESIKSSHGRLLSSRLLAGAVALALPCLWFTTGSRAAAQAMGPEVLEKTKHATVMVLTAYSKNEEGDTDYGSGSGFFVNATGLAITNNHVVDPGHGKPPDEKFQLKNELGRLVWTVVADSGTSDEKEYRSDVLYQNEKADIAILQVRDDDGEMLETPDYLKFYPTTDVTEDLKAWCLGYPGGDSRKGSEGEHAHVAVTAGNIVGLPRTPSGRVTMIWTDVLANQGNSGGPFVDAHGRLVGVLTLGSQSEARTNDTMLVPGDLVREMIRTAFERGKVAANVDIEPFYDLFVNGDRIWEIPAYARQEDQDCVILSTGSRICGSTADSTITWPSPLGDIEVPTSAMAYVLFSEGEDYAMAFVDGGDRFLVDYDARFRFAPPSADPVEIRLDDLAVVAFRKPADKPKPPEKPAYVITGDNYRLSLLDVSGKVPFKTALADFPVAAADFVAVSDEDGERVLHTRSGSRMLGSFGEHEVEAKLAWTGTPIKFTFAELENVRIKTVNYSRRVAAGEMPLAETLKDSDPRVVVIAELVDANDIPAAAGRLEAIMKSDAYRDMAKETQEQLQAMQGEFLMRSGKFNDAGEVFRRLRRARDDRVMWHARSRLAMLDRYSEGRYESGAISEPDVFRQAGRALAEEYTREGKRKVEELERIDVLSPTGSANLSRSDYRKALKRAEEAEEQLLIANRLTRGVTEELVVRLWRAEAGLHRGEIVRLNQEQGEVKEQERDDSRRRSEARRRQFEQKLERIARNIEEAQQALVEIQIKMRSAGFIIDDPDRDVVDD